MLKNPFNRFLCQEVVETPTGGAPAAAATAAPAAAPVQPAAPANGPPAVPAAPPVAAAAAPPRELTLLERAKAAVADKGTLIQERDAALTRAQTAESQLATVTADRDRLQGEVTRLTGERQQLETTLSGAQAAVQGEERRAANIVATQFGVDPAALPKQEQEAESIETLQSQLEKEKDPAKQWAICDKIEALRWKGN